MINGIKITLYGSDLDALIEEFAEAKRKRKAARIQKKQNYVERMFEEWFSPLRPIE